MDQDVARNKLTSLDRCLTRINNRLPATAALLATDADAQDIVSVNLQRAVQLCAHLCLMLVANQGLVNPADMAEGFQRLRDQGWITEPTYRAMRAAVGFRNISVHEYRKLDWQIVHRICAANLGDFRRFAQELVQAKLIEL